MAIRARFQFDDIYEQALMAARAGLSDSEFETVWADAHDAELFDEAR